MIESVFHLFKIHREVIFGNTPIVVQDMLGVTPKSLNTVDVILATIGKCFAVVQPVVFPPALQRIVTAEGICVIDRPFSGMLSDMTHQLVSGHLFHHLGVHPPVALQKAEDNAFPRSASSSFTLAPAAEVRLINLNLALELARFQFSHMVDRLAQALIDAGHHLIIKAKIARHAIGRLLLIETGDNANLFARAFERLLFSTRFVPAPDVPALRPRHPKRTTENALSAPQKVGRTVENVVSSSNHKGILTPHGYETH